jgi:HlyD family secretion protein
VKVNLRPPGAIRSWWTGLTTFVRGMSPRSRWVNLGLVLLLVALGVVAVRSVGPREQPLQVARTAQVTRGPVTATVTSSGNTEESLTTDVNFETDGTVTAINVKAGDRVEVGQLLATIDPASANFDLRTALADRDNAQAIYDQARAGITDIKKRQDQAAIDLAEQKVRNAQIALANAKDKLDLDKTSTSSSVDNAKERLSNTRRTQDDLVDSAEDNVDRCESGVSTTSTTSPATTTTRAPSSSSSSSSSSSRTTTTPSTTKNSSTDGETGVVLATPYTGGARVLTVADSDCASEEQALTSAKNTRRSSITDAEQDITTAEQTRDSTLQSDQQSIDDAQATVKNAQGDVVTARLTLEADTHPSTAAEIAEAFATLSGKQVAIEKAQLGVDQTQLKATTAGTVLQVNGEVGGSSSGTGGSSGSDDSDSTSTSSSSSGGSEFIVLGNLVQLAVSADVDEADAAKLQLGQQTTVTFTATGETATGTVTQISAASTVSDNVVRYPVTVTLNSAPQGAKAGQTTNLSVVTGKADAALHVPSAAITNLATGPQVTVRKDGVDTVTPVQIGLVGESDTEIKSGLREGDTVVLPAASGSTDTAGPGGRRGGGG